MADGVGVGDNTRALVITRGLAELTRLGVAMGGERATFAGLAGLGDLLATCMSPLSRNRHVGEQLGKGRKARRHRRARCAWWPKAFTRAVGPRARETPRRRDTDHARDRPRRARRGQRHGGLPGTRPTPAGSREPLRATHGGANQVHSGTAHHTARTAQQHGGTDDDVRLQSEDETGSGRMGKA